MDPFISLAYNILELFNWAIIIWIVMSLLTSFEIINRYNPLVQRVNSFFDQLLNPVLNPIRKVIPLIAGIDLSPLVLILGIQLLQSMLISYF